MGYEEFSAEAYRLAKRAVILRFDGAGVPAGYWHGHHEQDLPLISIRNGGRWLNIFLDGDGGVVEVTDSPITSTQPLFAYECESLPPVDGVFQHGSDAISEFLAANGWDRTDPYNDNFPSDIPAQYERLWQDNCPLYLSDVVAVMGGWHFPWPDGDYHERADQDLVIWTLEGAEPWVEVFKKNGVFTVMQRVT